MGAADRYWPWLVLLIYLILSRAADASLHIFTDNEFGRIYVWIDGGTDKQMEILPSVL